MFRSTVHMAGKFGVLMLLFMLSPIDTSYAAAECLLLSAQACPGMSMRCMKPDHCGGNMCPKAAAHMAGRRPARKTCPLKYSVTKSFEPAVTGKTRRPVTSITAMVFSFLQLNPVPAVGVHRAVVPAVSPPDIVILQRNLRI